MTITTETIQVRQDTSTNWSTNNPVPKAGEWCFETDTGITKIGDGSTNYNTLVPFRQTTATKTELDKLHGLSTTSTELGYVHGVTSAIQTQINSKFAKADIQTSFGETLSDEKVASEKLVKNSLDAKQDGITVANNSMLKASVLSAMNIVGENNSGRRYDEPKTLAKMISAAHSTYDVSKFTVTGTPTITDGIASGFSASDYITTPSIDWANADSWELIIPYKFTTTGTRETIVGDVSESTGLRLDKTDNELLSVYFGNSGSWIWYTNTVPETVLTANTQYFIKVAFSGTAYTLALSTDSGKTYTQKLTHDSTTKISSTAQRIGIRKSGNNPATNSIIDLKYFSITVDGITVFSGNKTGIDTIKPDNYTVVGSPTISADGIITYSNDSNYAKGVYSSLWNGKSWKLEFDIDFNPYLQDDLPASTVFMRICHSDSGFRYVPNWNSIIISFWNTDNGNGGHASLENVRSKLSKGKAHITVYFDYSTGEYYYTAEQNGTIYESTHKTLPDNNHDIKSQSSDLLIFNTYNGNATNPIYTPVDLNSAKFYIDGNLVYQPCLKIPYTLAANDKKFINPIYEDRAKDMAEQFGIAPYHILDEDNFNFAMPYGSVEEKVAPKIVVGHYESGASAWEQYLDRTMIQRGVMAADTDVTFPCSDEFADTNYTLTCPFSAKTTSGFTPSASGTYIAVGKF